MSGALPGAGVAVEGGGERACAQETQGSEQYLSQCAPLPSESACEAGGGPTPDLPRPTDPLALRTRALPRAHAGILAVERHPLEDLRVQNGTRTRHAIPRTFRKAGSRKEVTRQETWGAESRPRGGRLGQLSERRAGDIPRGGEGPAPHEGRADAAPTAVRAPVPSDVLHGLRDPGRRGQPAAPVPAPPQSRATFPASDGLPAPGGDPGGWQLRPGRPRAPGRAGGVRRAAPASPGAASALRPARPQDPRGRSPAPLSLPQAQIRRPDPRKAGRGAGAGGACPAPPSPRARSPMPCACASRPEAPDRRRAGTQTVTSRRRAGRERGPRRDRVPSGP